jgi:hypothetical protein
VLKGRVGVDVPVTAHVAVTLGVEVYFQHRRSDGPRSVGSAIDTTLGVRTTGDLAGLLF